MKNPKFAKHAKQFIDMFDKAVEMLGPDIELLTDILLDLVPAPRPLRRRERQF